MAQRSRQIRWYALVLLLATDLGFYILPVQTLDSETMAYLASLVVAIAVAFLLSALFQLVKVERILYRYATTGALGLVAGVITFIALEDSSFLSMEWVNSSGKILFIALNVLAALILFFYKGAKKNPVDSQ